MAQNRDRERVTLTLDPTLLGRIKAVSEARQEPLSRTVDRMLSSEIDAEEAFVTEMESPMNRAFIRAVAKRPEFVQGFLRLLGEQLSDEDIKKFTEGASKQSELGEERQRSKRGKRKRGKEATA